MNDLWNVDTPAGMAHAMLWTQAHLDRLNDGGTWFVPRSLSRYTFDKVNKTVVVVSMVSDTAIDKVLIRLGWTFKE